jgi:hypothetical protein
MTVAEPQVSDLVGTLPYMTPLPAAVPEATPSLVFAAWCRWWRRPRDRAPTAEEDACRQLALQAVLLRAAQLEPVLADVACPACRTRVPNVLLEGHAATCDAVPAVRRWRLAANEVFCLEAMRDPFRPLPGQWSPAVEDELTRALAGSGVFRWRLAPALRLLLDYESPPPTLSMEDLGLVLRERHAPPTLETYLPLFIAVTTSEAGLDTLVSDECPWCDAPTTRATLLPHLVECPRHPCLERAAVLEDLAEGRRGATRHPVVAVHEQLHARRTALRHLLAACDDFEDAFGWDGEHGYVRSGDERRFDLARAPLAALAETPLVLPAALPGSALEESVADTRAMHARLGTLLQACRDFTNRFSDDVRRASLPEKEREEAWCEARRRARAELAYRAVWDLDREAPLPRVVCLRSFEGTTIWRTGEALLDGEALATLLGRALGGRAFWP